MAAKTVPMIYATISMSALQHNIAVVRQLTASRIMAVVKADAYGHGIAACANTLAAAGCDALAVARIEEAQILRAALEENHASIPIVILSGIYSQAHLRICQSHRFIPVIHTRQAVEALQALPAKALSVWLKLDTGMHRLGLTEQQLSECWRWCRAQRWLAVVGVMSHLAQAEDHEDPKNQHQLTRLIKCQQAHSVVDTSLANSAAIMQNQRAHLQWVRPGIMLYGAHELNDPIPKVASDLKPVMTLHASVLHVVTVAKGESVGYQSRWTAKKNSRVATIACGYADGYPRHAVTGTPVLVNNTLCPLVGRVSMDTLAVDVTDVAVKSGDQAILWGHTLLPVHTVAKYAETISYQILTGVSPRVPRVIA